MLRYHSRISGPLLDRIDLIVEAPSLEYEELKQRGAAESSVEIKKRVDKAREIQRKRFEGSDCECNARIGSRLMGKFCALDREAEGLLHDAFEHMNLTARSYDRILRVSRTVADLSGSEHIAPEHIAEAIQYRTYNLGEA